MQPSPSTPRSMLVKPTQLPTTPADVIKLEPLGHEDELAVRRVPTRVEGPEQITSCSDAELGLSDPRPRSTSIPVTALDRELALKEDPKPYGPKNDPAKAVPGTDTSYVFPTSRPLRSLLAGINGHKFEDPDFPGKRRPSLDLGGSTGNMNPHYRSPSPPLIGQAASHSRAGGPESPYSQWFRRPSLFDTAAYQRRASRGNLHMQHPASRQRPYDRPYEGQYQPTPLLSTPRAPMCSNDSSNKNKRKRADPEQLAALVQVFERTPFPSTEERHALALKLGMTSRSVQIWFQNRRQTTKAAQMSAAQLAAIAVNDDLGTSQNDRHRALSISQLEALNDHFLGKGESPDEIEAMQLANSLGLDIAFIKGWFLHRRRAMHNAQLEGMGGQ